MFEHERVKQLILKKTPRLIDFAEEIGVNYRTMMNYLNKPMNSYNLDILEKIAEGLNVHPAYLCGWMSSTGEYENYSQYSDRKNVYIMIPSYTTQNDFVNDEGDLVQSKTIPSVTIPFDLLTTSNDIIAYQVTDNSMFPEYRKEDIVFININEETIPTNAVVLASVDDYNARLFNIEVEDENISFIPENKKYSTKTFNLYEGNYKIFGRVIKLLRNIGTGYKSKEDLTEELDLVELEQHRI